MKRSKHGYYWFTDAPRPWFFKIDLNTWGLSIETKERFVEVRILCFAFGWDGW